MAVHVIDGTSYLSKGFQVVAYMQGFSDGSMDLVVPSEGISDNWLAETKAEAIANGGDEIVILSERFLYHAENGSQHILCDATKHTLAANGEWIVSKCQNFDPCE